MIDGYCRDSKLIRDVKRCMKPKPQVSIETAAAIQTQLSFDRYRHEALEAMKDHLPLENRDILLRYFTFQEGKEEAAKLLGVPAPPDPFDLDDLTFPPPP